MRDDDDDTAMMMFTRILWGRVCGVAAAGARFARLWWSAGTAGCSVSFGGGSGWKTVKRYGEWNIFGVSRRVSFVCVCVWRYIIIPEKPNN